MSTAVFLQLPPGTGDSVSLAIVLCALLTAASLVYIFMPPRELASGAEKTRLSYLRERKEQVYENLRDLNFEYKAGKYPEADYQQMRTSLEDEAAAILAEMEQLESRSGVSRFTLGRSKPKGA